MASSPVSRELLTVVRAFPTATQNPQARWERATQKDAENCNTRGRQARSRCGREKRERAQDALACPRSFLSLKGLARRRRPERPCSASFCVAAAERPPAYSASLLDLETPL